MISSLMNKCSTIVRLVPLGSSSARELYPIVKNTICDIEIGNLFVEAVYTDNYPLNVNLFKLFSHDSGTLHPRLKIQSCRGNGNGKDFFPVGIPIGIPIGIPMGYSNMVSLGHP